MRVVYHKAGELRFLPGKDDQTVVMSKSGPVSLDTQQIQLLDYMSEPQSFDELCRFSAIHGLAGSAPVEEFVVASVHKMLRTEAAGETLQCDSGEQPGWNAPVLITGCPRSGTTALARSLSMHPRIAITNEYSMYCLQPYRESTWKRIMRAGNNHPPAGIAESAVSLAEKARAFFKIPADNEVLRQWLFEIHQPPPLVYGDKMPMMYLHQMKLVGRLFPRAKVLLTIRDGRAVVASSLRHFDERGESKNGSQRWAKDSVEEAQKLWLRNLKAWRSLRDNPPLPCLEIRYEEATSNPHHTLQRICEFLEIDYDEPAFSGFFDSFKPVNVNRWREEVPDMEHYLSDEFKSLLAEFDYT